MHETIRVILSADQQKRVVIFRRSVGTFGFRSEVWLVPEAAWAPAGHYAESVTASADEAEAQARARVNWLASGR